jgi:hypothetical protein
MSTQSDLLRDVAEVVAGERNRSYGSPRVNLDDRTALLWNAYIRSRAYVDTSNALNGIDVCMMMILLKMARIAHDPNVKDNYADIAGYAAAAWEIIDSINQDPPF